MPSYKWLFWYKYIITQKLKSKHLVCLSFLWWEVFLRELPLPVSGTRCNLFLFDFHQNCLTLLVFFWVFFINICLILGTYARSEQTPPSPPKSESPEVTIEDLDAEFEGMWFFKKIFFFQIYISRWRAKLILYNLMENAFLLAMYFTNRYLIGHYIH